MSVTISQTDAQALTVLRSFLLSILPAGVECVLGQTNRVPEPLSQSFVVLTPIMRRRLETTNDVYTDATDPVGNPSGTVAATAPVEMTVQMDFHGPTSGDSVQTFLTLWRDDYACEFFEQNGIDAAPLYASEPRQTPFINGENQYEFRWTIDACMQVNVTVTAPQSFSSTLGPVGIIELP